MHLFAGAGGGLLADLLLGHQPVCAVEINEYCQQVLSARQKDNCLPWFPIFADVTQFDGRPWRSHVDIIAGGFPCQDISVAGNGSGIGGERSGLWREMARIICEVRPRYVIVENSPMLTSRGLGTVLGDLAGMGFDAKWGVLGAKHVGAPHHRNRIWIVANSDKDRLQGWQKAGDCGGVWEKRTQQLERLLSADTWMDQAVSGCFRKPDVVADWVDRLKAIGNGQVPSVARLAWEILK
jgi:DNA (cytosine-5)-methyltransferase 1